MSQAASDGGRIVYSGTLRNKLISVPLGLACVIMIIMFTLHQSTNATGAQCNQRKALNTNNHAHSESDDAAVRNKLAQLESDYAALLQNHTVSPTARVRAHYASLEAEYATWVKTFVAPKAKHQDFCMKFLTQQNTDGNSQFAQDTFVFFNVFKHWPMRGRKGFYVDSGTNDAVLHSNTYFFDVCLGWPGLCVEPNESYHHGIRTERSCILIPECISDKETTVSFDNLGGGGKIQGGSGTTACTTLEKMLKRSVNRNQEVIDFWSLDVEGHEMSVLNSVDFKRISVRALLVEDFFLSLRDLDYLLYKKGFKKLAPLGIDSLYAPKDLEEPLEFWYPDNFFKHIEFHQQWRKTKKPGLEIVC